MKLNRFIQLLLVCAVFILYSCGQNASNETEESEGIESAINMMLSTSSEEAKESFGQGLRQYYVGDIMKARNLFDAAIAADQEFALAYTYRAYTSLGPKDFATFSNKANGLSTNASEAEKLLIDINQTFMANDLNNRVTIAESLVKKFPMNFIGRLELADAYGASNRVEDSRKQLLQAISDNPNKGRPLMDLSSSFIFEDPKDLSQAEQYAKKSVDVIPDVSSTHIMLGDVYRAQNNLAGALTAYKKASEVNPKDFVALSKQGHANTFLGNFADARANFAAADLLDDEGIGMTNFSILTKVYDGNYEEALSQYSNEIAKIDGSQSSKMNSNRSSLLVSAMRVAYHAGNSDMLETLMAQYKETEIKIGEDVGTEQIKVSIQAGLKNWDARLAVLNNDLESAKAYMEEYNSLMEPINNPNKMNAYNVGMGLISLADGEASAAIEYLKKVDAQNIYARYHLAKALEMNGEMDEAMEHYKYLSTYNFNSTTYALMRSDCMSKVGI